MPGGFPLGLEFCNGTDIGTVAGTSLGTTVTTGAANTKGSYAQLTAATASDCSWLAVVVGPNTASSAFTSMVDIGVGIGGSEIIIANNLVASSTSRVSSICYLFPCNIAAGTRVAARAQADTATQTVWVSAILFDGAFTQIEGAAGVDSIGAVTATTKGTAIDPGATINTKGSYAQLSASTSRDYMGFLIGLDTNAATAASDYSGLMDIATGAGGSERIILPNLQTLRTIQMIWPQGAGPFWIPIPSGTRIAARAQANFNTATTRITDLILYGIYQ